MAYNPQNPNGQVNMASSAPMVLASDQSTNWNGELIEAIEALRTALVALTRSSTGMSLPDTAGRQRVTIEASPATVPVSGSVTATVASTTISSGTVNVTTLTNQTQIGGIIAVDQIPSLMNMVGQNLRRNIIVT
jgi:hypothetical protein